jgi:hypothetical protein
MIFGPAEGHHYFRTRAVPTGGEAHFKKYNTDTFLFFNAGSINMPPLSLKPNLML